MNVVSLVVSADIGVVHPQALLQSKRLPQVRKTGCVLAAGRGNQGQKRSAWLPQTGKTGDVLAAVGGAGPNRDRSATTIRKNRQGVSRREEMWESGNGGV